MEYTFEDFKNRANSKNLSKNEKIGFPDSYRIEKDKHILEDISFKLNLFKSKSFLDIGCGCSDLVVHIIKNCIKRKSKIHLIDSEEMLSQISTELLVNDLVNTFPGSFPKISKKLKIKYDSILVYSVIQYSFAHDNFYNFIHSCLDLLNPGGRLLIGDIPNFQSRERFLNSNSGNDFKKSFDNKNFDFKIVHNDRERIDDSVVMSVLSRFRTFGYETYLMPQNEILPFANRREDILIIKRI